MRWSEFIDKVRDAPPDGEVMIWDPNYGFSEIQSVEVGPEGVLIR